MPKFNSYKDINFEDIITDIDDAQNQKVYKKLPDGTYICQVLNSSLHTNRKGTQSIKIDLVVSDMDESEYKGHQFSRFVSTMFFGPKGMLAMDVYRVFKPIMGDELTAISTDEELYELLNRMADMIITVVIKNKEGSDYPEYKFYSYSDK